MLGACGVKENPHDRNYLSFPNDNTDEIIDSLYSFQKMVRSMNLPKNEDINATWFNYFDNNLEITNEEIGKINFEVFRNAKCLDYLSDSQIHDFIKLFKFLFNNFILPGMYYYDQDKMNFEYKKYYYMYNTLVYDDDLNRFLSIEGTEHSLDVSHFKILDSYRNLYLLTYQRSQIWGDSTKYKIDPKFRIE